MQESSNNNNNNNKSDFVFYYNNSPNAFKIQIILYELTKSKNITFETRFIDISKKENYSEEFVKINPNKKVPALVDQTNEKSFVVFESVSILIYLAQKYNEFLPEFKSNPQANSEVLNWTIWQCANLGPAMGQFNHFFKYSPTVQEYSLQRFNNEVQRILRLLDDRLSTNKFIGGDEYSIADIASAGWLLYLNFSPSYNATKERFPNIFNWLSTINQRDAISTVNKNILESFKSFNIHSIRALYSNDQDSVKEKAPIDIEKVVLNYD